MKGLAGIKKKWRLWVGMFIMLVGFALTGCLAIGIVVITVGFGLFMWQAFIDRTNRRNGVM